MYAKVMKPLSRGGLAVAIVEDYTGPIKNCVFLKFHSGDNEACKIVTGLYGAFVTCVASSCIKKAEQKADGFVD